MLTGSYLCAQGRTALVLRVRDVRGSALRVEFDFLHAASRAAGRYTLTGLCTTDGRVRLDPEAWIVRPPNYIMVGMDGAVSGETFRGVITHPSCGDFTVTRAGH